MIFYFLKIHIYLKASLLTKLQRYIAMHGSCIRKKKTDWMELIWKIVLVNSTKKHFIITPPKHALLSLQRTPAVIHTRQLIIDYKKQCPLSSKHQIFRGLQMEQSVQWLWKCDVRSFAGSLFEISPFYSIYSTPYLKKKSGLRIVHGVLP